MYQAFLRGLFHALLLMTTIASTVARAADDARIEYAIAVHGGAGAWAGVSDDELAAVQADLQRAVTMGRDMLARARLREW